MFGQLSIQKTYKGAPVCFNFTKSSFVRHKNHEGESHRPEQHPSAPGKNCVGWNHCCVLPCIAQRLHHSPAGRLPAPRRLSRPPREQRRGAWRLRDAQGWCVEKPEEPPSSRLNVNVNVSVMVRLLVPESRRRV